jgi:CRP-like cAMP-binding protein
MSEVFFQRFKEKVPLSDLEEQALKAHLVHKKLRKRQYFLQEGDVCRNVAFIEKGIMRSYMVDGDGQEHIFSFALEGWAIGDLSSFLSEQISTQHIDALEDCQLVLISKSSHDQLLATMPKYATFFRILMTDAYIALQKRTSNILSMSLEDRYKFFVGQYPNIVQRVPQHMIASHMGLSAETLSRIRSRISKG